MLLILIIGWLLGLVTLLIGFFIGIYLTRIEKKIVEIKGRFHKPPPESGPVKPYTPAEKEELDNPQNRRLKEIL
jgi:hypothetical protein